MQTEIDNDTNRPGEPMRPVKTDARGGEILLQGFSLLDVKTAFLTSGGIN